MEKLIRVLIEADPDQSYEAHTELVRLGAQSVEPLLASLFGASDRDCWRILKTLTSIGDSRAISGAIQCMHSNSAAVLAASAQCLAEIGGDEAVEALLALVDDCSRSVSMMWIIQALSSLNDPRIAPTLIRLVETTSSSVDRYTAIEALARIGDKRAISVIQKFANDENHHVRSKAHMALQMLA